MAPNFSKRINRTIGMVVLVMCLSVIVLADAQVADINTLISDSELYDGQTITLSGETLLSGLKQGNMRWININDGSNAIGLFMDLHAYEKINWYGRYGVVGDQVLVTGTFNRACREHGGDMDIHVSTLEVTKTGYKKSVSIGTTKMYLAVLLTGLTLMLLALYSVSKNGFKRP